jgi:hypothetical protein
MDDSTRNHHGQVRRSVAQTPNPSNNTGRDEWRESTARRRTARATVYGYGGGQPLD